MKADADKTTSELVLELKQLKTTVPKNLLLNFQMT